MAPTSFIPIIFLLSFITILLICPVLLLLNYWGLFSLLFIVLLFRNNTYMLNQHFSKFNLLAVAARHSLRAGSSTAPAS